MTETRIRVRATTPTKARVRRAWNVRGASLRARRRSRPRCCCSTLGERVANPSDGQDEGRNGRVVLDLVPQVTDVDVDRLLVLVEGLVVAEELEEVAPCIDPAGSRGEVAEDLELRRGQADAPLAALDAPPLQVDDEIAVADDPPTRGVGEIAVGPPEQGLDPAHQLAQAERLGQVVVCAELEPDDLVDLIVAGGQDED